MSHYHSHSFSWRHGLRVFLELLPLLLLLRLDPIPQDVAHHNFADTRRIFGVPNFFNVVSILPFLPVGAAGIAFCLNSDLGPSRSAWLVFFAAVSLVSLGSVYYHWQPDNEGLVWDRLPMGIAFMGFFTAILSEHVNSRLSGLLIPLVTTGICSVLYWHFFDDLRLYSWLQFTPLLMLPAIMALFRSRRTHQWLLLAAIACYALAKGAEVYDAAVFEITGEVVSGESVKHLLAAAGCYCILAMLQRRTLRV